jgi:hypothetical protein
LSNEALIVMFEDLFDEGVREGVERVGDIHSYLNFDGKVLASSIMPDDLITQEAPSLDLLLGINRGLTLQISYSGHTPRRGLVLFNDHSRSQRYLRTWLG